VTENPTSHEHPTMEDLRWAGTEVRLRRMQQELDALVAALPWWCRVLFRLFLRIHRAHLRLRRGHR
jgi:hypothetical protein